jgi:hypothetical protein
MCVFAGFSNPLGDIQCGTSIIRMPRKSKRNQSKSHGNITSTERHVYDDEKGNHHQQERNTETKDTRSPDSGTKDPGSVVGSTDQETGIIALLMVM